VNVALAYWKSIYPNGIDGHQIELDVRDDAGSPSQGVAATNQFVADHDAAVIHVSDNFEVQSLQMSALAKANMPVVSYANSDQYTNVANFPYVFSTSNSNAQAGEVTAKWIASHNFKRIALLTDNEPTIVSEYNAVLNPLKTLSPDTKVVTTAQVSTSQLDYGTAISQLRGASPDLTMVFVSGNFGNVWQAMKAAGWNSEVLTTSYALYDAYDAMGSLASNIKVMVQDCVDPGVTPAFPAAVTSMMNQYYAQVGKYSPNMLTYVDTNAIEIGLVLTAIQKYNSTSPAAIRQAMEQYNGSLIWDQFQYHFTPTNHFGNVGPLGLTVCNAAPFADGQYQIPTVSK
jgi:ABC-type branched-subunit amino acid transport system substrate-binding protein